MLLPILHAPFHSAPFMTIGDSSCLQVAAVSPAAYIGERLVDPADLAPQSPTQASEAGAAVQTEQAQAFMWRSIQWASTHRV